jgi:hypothetical protein
LADLVVAAFLGADLAELFLAAFFADFGPAALAEATFADFFPPNTPSQPEEYFSFVPTRVIVTETPFAKIQINFGRTELHIEQVSRCWIIWSIRFRTIRTLLISI